VRFRTGSSLFLFLQGQARTVESIGWQFHRPKSNDNVRRRGRCGHHQGLFDIVFAGTQHDMNTSGLFLVFAGRAAAAAAAAAIFVSTGHHQGPWNRGIINGHTGMKAVIFLPGRGR